MQDFQEWRAERTAAARNDPRSTYELVRLALSSDEELAWEAIQLLQARASRDVLVEAQQLTESRMAHERARGADIIGGMGIGERVFQSERQQVLLGLLYRETESEVLQAVAAAFGHYPTPVAVPGLARLADHRDWRVRHNVVMGLAGQEHPLAIAALMHLTEDVEEIVRDWATFGLGSQVEVDTPAIRDALARRLHDSDSVVRGEALVGLAHRQDPRARGALEAARSDGTDEYLVYEAADLLAKSAWAAFPEVHAVPLMWSLTAAGLLWLIRRRQTRSSAEIPEG